MKTRFDRRRQTDLWARIFLSLNLFSWVLLLFLLLVFHRAQPQFESFFDRFYPLHLRTTWDHQYLYYLSILAAAGILVSLGGLCLGMVRGRRRDDHKKALVITGLMSIVLLGVTFFVV